MLAKVMHPVKIHRVGNWLLQLLVLNKEFLVSIIHHTVLIMSLPFVHTARRSYRLNNPVNELDCRMHSLLLHGGVSLINLII